MEKPTPIDIINKIQPAIDTWVKSNNTLYEPSSDTIFNIVKYNDRGEQLEYLKRMSAVLMKAYDHMQASIDALAVRHMLDQTCLHTLLKMTPVATAATSSTPTSAQVVSGAASTSSQWTVVTKKIKPVDFERIHLTSEHSLMAKRVNNFNQVITNGELYYIDNADHFAIRICGHLLHGNIGRIYVDGTNPEKIRDCKFAASCTKLTNCDYYHDPMKHPGSKDHRNFIASSFMYTNANYQNRLRSRKIGSIENLDSDIVQLGDEEVLRFYDQTMHDLLITLILKAVESNY